MRYNSGMKLQRAAAFILYVVITAFTCWPNPVSADPIPQIPNPGNVHLTFDDEFDGAAIDSSKWSTAFAAHNRLRGPGDQGYYAESAVTVQDGSAVITSTNTPTQGKPY